MLQSTVVIFVEIFNYNFWQCQLQFAMMKFYFPVNKNKIEFLLKHFYYCSGCIFTHFRFCPEMFFPEAFLGKKL
jgi:hypothetical protein